MNKLKEALEKIVNQPKEVVENGYYGNFEDIIHIAQQALSTEQSEPSEKLKVTGETSDGYHTFNELYEFRKVYNATLFNEWAAQGKYGVHKSMKHHDGELCFGGGWFIVVAVLPSGQISNHYEMSDWGLFDVPSFDKAQYEFDGHTAHDVVVRLQSLSPNEGKEESANYVARVCEKHVWGLVETTATGQEPKTNIQCLYCGASKENGFKHTEPNQTEAEKDEFRQLYDWLLHNGTYLDADEKTIIYYEEPLFAKMNEIRSKSVGDLLEGEHPDEIYPRAGSWLQERRNWAAQVKQLEEYASLARKQVIEEIEEWIEQNTLYSPIWVNDVQDGEIPYIDYEALLKYLQTLKP